MKYVSNSEVQAFKRCKRKWWLSYHRKMRPMVKDYTSKAELGTIIHECIEQFYKYGVDPVAHLAGAVTPRLQSECPEAQWSELAGNLELAQIMLSGFMEWRETEGIDAGYEILATEERVSQLLSGHGDVALIGKLDLTLRRLVDDAVVFRDWKSVGAIDRNSWRWNEQPKTYGLLQRMRGMAAHGAERVQLRRVKRTARANPPFYAIDSVSFTDAQLQLFYRQLWGEVQDILRTAAQLNNGDDPLSVAYPTPTNDCSWDCEFYAICPLFSNGEDGEGTLRAYFEEYDPLERYEVKS